MAGPMHIGIVGLGIMGSAIGTNLVASGFDVAGFDPGSGRRDILQRAGGTPLGSVQRLCEHADIILTSLPNEDALSATVDAIVAARDSSKIVIETSTLKLADKRRAETSLMAAGHVLLDCPLSGTGAQARTRDLTVYASGDSAAISAVEQVFTGFANAFFDLGEFGNGSKMKYIANLLVVIHNLAAAEAITLGRKAGLDPQQIVDVVKLGAGGSRMLEVRGPLMARADYSNVTAGFPMYHKDIGIIGAFAAEMECPTPLLGASLPYYLAGGVAYPDEDVAALCKVLEKMAGMRA